MNGVPVAHNDLPCLGIITEVIADLGRRHAARVYDVGKDTALPAPAAWQRWVRPRLDREARVSFEHVLRELRPLAWAP